MRGWTPPESNQCPHPTTCSEAAHQCLDNCKATENITALIKELILEDVILNGVETDGT